MNSNSTQAKPSKASLPNVLLNRIKSAWMILKRLRQSQDNLIAAWPKFCYKKKIVAFRVFRKSLFIVNDPPSVQRVMAANGKNYVKSPMNTQALKPILGNGLFVSEGELWTRQRRVMAPATHTNRLAGYAEIILEEGRDTLAKWELLPEGSVFDTAEKFTLLTAEIISRIMFGFRLGDHRVNELYEAFKEYQASHGRTHIPSFLVFPHRFRDGACGEAGRRFNDLIRYCWRF